MRNKMGSCCLIRGVRQIVGGSRGVVSAYCRLMMRRMLCGGRLYGCILVISHAEQVLIRSLLEVMNDRYALLLELDTFINLIHEKFGVETFNAHNVSKAVDSGDPIVLLTISVVNFNGLPLRTHKHIVL